MCSFSVVFFDPQIQVSLQLLKVIIHVLAECDLVDLFLDGPVEAFADAVCLWAVRFCARVLYAIDRQEQLVVVMLWAAAELCSSIRQDAY